MIEGQLPRLKTAIPGPRSGALAERLARVECPEVTLLTVAPVFWQQSSGANVYDVDGNRLVDLLGGFGASSLGHAHKEVVEAIAQQAAQMPNVLGDVFPAALKVDLLEAVERTLPGDLGCAILSANGSDAVESALKTALMVTGKPGVIAFEGAYHGLGLGALDVTHRSIFREAFTGRLPERTHFVPYGDPDAVRAVLRDFEVGAILFEPIQGRGGVVVPPAGFVSALRELADESGVLLIADEVYTGFGRTGRWLACEHESVLPDVVTLGKGIGGGFPISLCAGRPDVMRRWPASTGEALHTSTHLGNPMGCAAALAVLRVMEREDLPARAARVGESTLKRMRERLACCAGVRDVRGRGLMLGIELDSSEEAERVVGTMLSEGWILLPEGPEANVLSLTPALTISEELLAAATDRIAELLR
ncbi:MAG: aspartate aminotransferase family protein [bacterium]|nr:aspartate aminotransferase family protein [bacterium]